MLLQNQIKVILVYKTCYQSFKYMCVTWFTLPEHLSSPPVFSGVCVTRSLVLRVMVCRSLFFVFFSAFVLFLVGFFLGGGIFFCLSSDLRILTTPFGIFKFFLRVILVWRVYRL